MASTPEQREFARTLAKLDERVERAERASNLRHSTLAIDGREVRVPDALGDGVRAAFEIPGLDDRITRNAAALEDAERAVAEAKELAEKARTDGLAAAEEAEAAADAALARAVSAINAAQGAVRDANTAIGRADDARTQAANAVSAAGTAQSRADQAVTDAANARTAATTADSKATAADSKAAAAQMAAGTAQTAANAAATNATRAQTTADTANEAALTAAGVAGSKGRVWFQPSTPPEGGAYAWTAGVDDSPSTRTEGSVVRTQRIPNPRAVSTKWWQPAAASATPTGDGGLRITPTGTTGTTYLYATPTADIANPSRGRFAITPGQSYALGLVVTNVSNETLQVRGGVAFYNDAGAGGVSTNKLTPAYTLLAGESRPIEVLGTLPAADTAATGSLPLLYVYAASGGVAPATAVTVTREWQFEIADQPFEKAPAFFTGATPSDRDLDLWIDTTGGANTPKRRSGGAWVAVTDKAATDAAAAAATSNTAAGTAKAAADAAQKTATDAGNAAAAAKAAADAAQSTATTAQSTADGKSTIRYGTSAPTSGTPGSLGDLYFVRTAPTTGTPQITAFYERTVGGYAERPMTSAVFAFIDAGKITAGILSADRIAAASLTGAKFVADAITTRELAAGAVTAAQLSAAAVTAGKIAAGAIVAADIAAGTITGEKISAATITAAKLLADTITTRELSADSVTAAKLAVDAVLARNIKAGEITAGKLAAASVATGNLAAGAVTAEKIAAGAITAEKIAAGAVTANELSADAINGKTINGVTIRGGTIIGGTLASSTGSKRVEIREREITFFAANGAPGSTYSDAVIEAVGDSTPTTDPIVWLKLGGKVQAGAAHSVARVGQTAPYAFVTLDAPSAAFETVMTDVLFDMRGVANGGSNRSSGNVLDHIPQNDLPTTVLAGRVPPAGTRLITQSGIAPCNTVGSGDSNVVYKTPFPNGVCWLHLQRYDFSVFGQTSHILNTTQSLSQGNFRVFQTNGNPLPNVSGIKYQWTAVGW